MAKCAICEKAAHFGNGVSHSHRRSNKIWKANVKSVKVKVNGGAQKMYVCTSCLRSSSGRESLIPPNQITTKPRHVNQNLVHMPFLFCSESFPMPETGMQKAARRVSTADRSRSLSACLFTVRNPPRYSRMPAVSVTGRENPMALALVSRPAFP